MVAELTAWFHKAAFQLVTTDPYYWYWGRKSLGRYAAAYFSPSWTAFQADRGRDFSVIVDGISN
jgi:hypothetical protein